MLRYSMALRRTSRRGAGGWSTPQLASLGRQISEQRGAQQRGPRAHDVRGPGDTSTLRGKTGEPSSFSSPLSFFSSASFYSDGGGGADAARAERERYSWRADARFSSVPERFRHLRPEAVTRSAMSSASPTSTDFGSTRRVEHERVDEDARVRATATGADSGAEKAFSPDSARNWVGGKMQQRMGDEGTSSMRRGAADFSMIDRQTVTLTHVLRMLVDATLQPRNPDAGVFGGDNSTKMAEQREELKNMDSRIVPSHHEEVMNDYLKNIEMLHSPSGRTVSRDMLRGRMVGILFFSESDRCLRFMRKLKAFHRTNSPDFVVVAVSLGGKELMDISRGFGFFHCAHRDGATWVQRDAGVAVRPFSPLPKLLIVDGTSGVEVTRSGVSAVLLHPTTCFDEWKRGGSGVEPYDWAKMLFF